MSDDLSDLHPDTVNPATLVDRLRGHYRLPIKDGLGPVKGGDEPDSPEEYVRTFGPVPPIQRVAAAEIERLRAALDAAEAKTLSAYELALIRLKERDAALAARDAGWCAGRDAAADRLANAAIILLSNGRARVSQANQSLATNFRVLENKVRALQPPADLAAEAPGDAVAKERDMPTLEEARNILRARAGA